MENPSKKDIIIVIRSCHERTVELCRFLVAEQVRNSQIFVIEEKPFFEAVKKTFEIGAKSNAKYLLGLDADILLFPDAIDYMMYEAQKYSSDSFFRIDFPIYDKFRGRVTGVHFYNNKYSKQFLGFLNSQKFYAKNVRPEYDSIRAFSQDLSLSFRNVPHYIVAKHDYFQYYRDIFKKYKMRRERCVIEKNLEKISMSIYDLNQKMLDDFDYMIALAGIKSKVNEGLNIDEFLSRYGFKEKDDLSPYSFESISDALMQSKIMDKIKDGH